MQNMFVEISSLECERECVKYWSKEKERYKEVWRQGEVEIKRERERLFDVGSLARKWKGGTRKGAEWVPECHMNAFQMYQYWKNNTKKWCSKLGKWRPETKKKKKSGGYNFFFDSIPFPCHLSAQACQGPLHENDHFQLSLFSSTLPSVCPLSFSECALDTLSLSFFFPLSVPTLPTLLKFKQFFQSVKVLADFVPHFSLLIWSFGTDTLGSNSCQLGAQKCS